MITETGLTFLSFFSILVITEPVAQLGQTGWCFCFAVFIIIIVVTIVFK